MESKIAKNTNVRCGAAVRRMGEVRERLGGCARRRMAQAQLRLMNEKGQGTTEYAILVGVLVVIAIVAITMFRPKIEELWNAIANGINGL